MTKVLKNSFTWALSIITILFTFIPESCFDVFKFCEEIPREANIILNRFLTYIAILILVTIIYTLICRRRTSVTIKGHGYSIKIEYEDIFKKDNCKKVINFDECFTTKVGSEPSEIKPTSVCGQYLLTHPIDSSQMQTLIANAGLKPTRSKSKYQNQTRYESGRIVPNGEYLLMAFAKLGKDGRGQFFSQDEFLDCLSILWNEIDKYYCQTDVCIPILGSGLTRVGDKILTQQELLDIIITSYQLSTYKLKAPYQLYIVCKKNDDFSLQRIGQML